MSNNSSKVYLNLSNGDNYAVYDIQKFAEEKGININRLPFSIKVLLENLLRNFSNEKNAIVKEEDVLNVANWKPVYDRQVEIPYYPSRVVMQDFTGVPAVVDLAAMRDAIKELGKNPEEINPAIPVDLIIDHSVQIDYYGTPKALLQNMSLEFKRNKERYSLLKWAQNAFDNFNIYPPGSGIIHQVNLEHLARVVASGKMNGEKTAFPDTLIGTDSHTTMIDGIGVMGWGVGGIEAESVMLGQPLYMKIPEVIGVRLVGELAPGATATDMVLTITQILRKEKVVEKFVEFFGPGMKKLSLPDRAMVANMAPEYGATMGFFPVDEQVLNYLEMTNRAHLNELVEKYTKMQDLFYTGSEEPEYTKVIEVNLADVVPSLAGPSRPQDRINLTDLDTSFTTTLQERKVDKVREVKINLDGTETVLSDGSIVMAAITSCTNTSNPAVLIGAGLLAKKAVEKGLTVPAHVKTSFAPGSRAVEEYLKKAELLPYLEQLGFNIVGFGCTTCIGNSGPLHPEIEKAIIDNNLVTAAILSGNRNFEARIHQQIKANYLASPLLVVAFALTGKINFNMDKEAIGNDKNGNPVFLKDIWPGMEEINELINSSINSEIFAAKYKNILDGDENWQKLETGTGETFNWDKDSTYIRRVPFFENFSLNVSEPKDIKDAYALLVLGDSVTTDHISPAGAIPEEYPAGQYLKEHGVSKIDFNTYGSRRGNHEVMMRGTFANIRIKNKLTAPKEGGLTVKLPEKEETYVFDAAMKYAKENRSLVVLGGKEYGTGSSRDWAAKGTQLLGVKAVIAESYERIHRSNLIGMGVLPLEFTDGDSVASLNLTGFETFTVEGITDLTPGKKVSVTAKKEDGTEITFSAKVRLDTDIEVEYYKNEGILSYVLRDMAK